MKSLSTRRSQNLPQVHFPFLSFSHFSLPLTPHRQLPPSSSLPWSLPPLSLLYISLTSSHLTHFHFFFTFFFFPYLHYHSFPPPVHSFFKKWVSCSFSFSYLFIHFIFSFYINCSYFVEFAWLSLDICFP